MKKGFVADQAKWIFVVIAGGVIFLFLFRVLTSQSSATDAQVAADIVAVITAVAAGVSSESTETINLPERASIAYNCESRILTVNGAQRRYVGDAVLFVKRDLITSSMVIHVQEYKIPYTAAIAVFITDTVSEVTNQDVYDLVGNFDVDSSPGNNNKLCGENELLQRAKLTTDVLRERAIEFAGCHGGYAALDQNAVQIMDSYYTAPNFAALNTLVDNSKQRLEQRNNQVIRASCPAIY